MVKRIELRVKHKECEKNIMWNKKNMCDEWDALRRCDVGVINNNNEEVNDMCEIKCGKVVNANERK